jgi:hypothetical protein
VDAAERVGTRPFLGLSLCYLGEGYTIIGRFEEGRKVLESGLAILRETRTYLFSEPHFLAYLARSCLGAGDEASALAAATDAVERARIGRIRVYEPAALLARAHVVRSLGGPQADVEMDLRDGLELSTSRGARSWAPLFHEEQARVALEIGDRATYAAEWDTAGRLYSDNGADRHSERLAEEFES